MLKHIDLFYFISGIIAGAIILYVYKAEKKVIIKYPHPDTVNKQIYRDINNICYKFNVKEVDCDEHAGKITEYPLQE
jgi:hypothetical protein